MNRSIFYRVIMAVLSISTLLVASTSSVYAMDMQDYTESTDSNEVSITGNVNGSDIVTTYEIDLSTCEVDDEGYYIIPVTTSTNYVSSSFTMSSYHRGGDRVYEGNYLTYTVTATDTSGNATSNKLTLQLWDYNHSYALYEHTITADGSTNKVRNISITDGRTYYFKYYNSGSTSLKVSMVISSTY